MTPSSVGRKLSEHRQFYTAHPGWRLKMKYGVPILHDTAIKLTVQNVTPVASKNNAWLSERMEADDGGDEDAVTSPSECLEYIKFDGQVVGDLNLVITKQIYEQILKTVDNITPTNDSTVTSSNVRRDSDAAKPSSLDHGFSTSTINNGIPSVPHVPFADKRRRKSSLESLTDTDDTPVLIRGSFRLPVISVKMMVTLGGFESGLVNLNLENFSVSVKVDRYIKTLDIHLQTLVLEDLLQEEGWWLRHALIELQKYK